MLSIVLVLKSAVPPNESFYSDI